MKITKATMKVIIYLRVSTDEQSEQRQVGVLVPIEAEQEVVGRMRSWRADDAASYREIATRLNLEGIPTKTGKGDWVHTAIRRILTRRVARLGLACQL